MIIETKLVELIFTKEYSYAEPHADRVNTYTLTTKEGEKVAWKDSNYKHGTTGEFFNL